VLIRVHTLLISESCLDGREEHLNLNSSRCRFVYRATDGIELFRSYVLRLVWYLCDELRLNTLVLSSILG